MSVIDGIARSADLAYRFGIKPALGLIAALVFLIEDALWAVLRPLMAWAAQWPVIARIEAFLRGVGPRTYLTLFLIPLVIVWPIKILALILIQSGRVVLGLTVLVGAKLLGTAIAARLWAIGRDRLLTIAWFARAHALVRDWHDRLYAWVGSLAPVRLARRWVSDMRLALGGLGRRA